MHWMCFLEEKDSNDADVNPLSWIYLILLFHRPPEMTRTVSYGMNAAAVPSHHHHRHITNSPPCHGVGTLKLKDTKAQRTSPFGDNEVDKQH